MSEGKKKGVVNKKKKTEIKHYTNNTCSYKERHQRKGPH